MQSDEKSDQVACSRCGGTAVPIAYGYPGPEMMEASERGEIVLGGCMVSEGQPTRRCRDCGANLGFRGDRTP